MEEKRVIDIKQEILSANDIAAEAFRRKLTAQKTLFVDIMSSPGAGKTTLLLALVRHLDHDASIGVIEADIASYVDAQKIKEAGIAVVQLQTHGICHVEMSMVSRGYRAFAGRRFDYLFLENIGNLVCPAQFDTGAHVRIMLLSVPEGYDKVYKYPLMFSAVDALVITKTDYLALNPDFDMDELEKQARILNPTLEIFKTSARTDKGIAELADWIAAKRNESIGCDASATNERDPDNKGGI
ncbi:MAG: hydrogenase nickel incorporation protein HypB [Eggerthellaceae bacterium]|nr:hydrogenase nickel incorporation protein HypB [Eggerthellaceae bacterium]